MTPFFTHGVHASAKKWPLLVREVPYILQGSVATRLRCGGIFSDDYVVYIVLSNVQYLKDYENRTAFEEAIYEQISGRPTFFVTMVLSAPHCL